MLLQAEAIQNFHSAVKSGSVEAVHNLLNGSTMRLDTIYIHNDHTLLHVAAWEGHARVVTLLLEAGASVNHRTKYTAQTPLHMASHQGWMLTSNVLLILGADITLQDTYGSTPLHSAATAGHLSVIRLLMRHAGVKCLQVRNRSRLRPKDCARRGDHHEVVQYLAVVERYTGGHRQSTYGKITYLGAGVVFRTWISKQFVDVYLPCISICIL